MIKELFSPFFFLSTKIQEIYTVCLTVYHEVFDANIFGSGHGFKRKD